MHIHDIKYQIETLRHIFRLPSHSSNAQWIVDEGLPPIPDGADGWFAVPNHHLVPLDMVILALIERNGLLIDPAMPTQTSSIRRHTKTGDTLTRISRSQPGSILIIPAQLGQSRIGSSVEGVKRTIMPKEFILDAFTVGCILLTHPDYHMKDTRGIICGGTLIAPKGVFRHSAKFEWRNSAIVLDYHANNLSNPRLGVATGFEI